jgi:peptide deformylase
MQPIHLLGSDTLRRKCDPVHLVSNDFQDLLFNLQQTADELNAMGLSSNQLGFFQRAFILKSPDHSKIFINPEIIWTSDGTVSRHEGCLSIPIPSDDLPIITRFSAITVKYQDTDFMRHESTYEGIPAAIIQHEIDHLDGRLMTDLSHSEWRRKNKRHLRNIRQGLVQPNYDAVIAQKGKIVRRFQKSDLEV